MPLIKGKSEDSFKKNLRTEYDAGHPLKQSLAIAYAMKRKAQDKAKGGYIQEEKKSGYQTMPKEDDDCYYCARGSCMMHKAHGGYIEDEKSSGYGSEPEYHMHSNKRAMDDSEEEDEKDYHEDEDDGHSDVVERIMKQRMAHGGKMRRMANGGKMDHYSRGGQVSNADHGEDDDELADFEPNEFDDLYLRDNDMEDADYTGRNSGDELDNDQEEDDRHDIVSRIMRSRGKKDRMPIPGYGTTYGKYK